MRKIRPLTLADGFEPGRLRRQVQTANAGKQAHMGKFCFNLFVHLLLLGIRKPASFCEAGLVLIVIMYVSTIRTNIFMS